jgi:hypothetical protein
MMIRGYIVMILVFSMLVTGTYLFIADFGSYYGKSTQDFQGLGKVNEIKNTTDELRQVFENKMAGADIVSDVILTITGFGVMLKLIYISLFGFYDTIFNSIFYYFGGYVPSWFQGGIEAIVLVIILFELISWVVTKNQQ